jgi:hypothetical protein
MRLEGKRREVMNTNITPKKRSISFRVVALAGIVLGTVLFGTACHEGAEGDRCNPVAAANGEDECNSGLTCQSPFTCVESYCCPANLSSSTNPFCNGMMCPAAPDAGTDGGDGG